MLRHIVLVKLNEDVDQAGSDALCDAIRAMRDEIPEILAQEIHLDAGLGKRNYDMAIVAEFADADALQTYLRHDAHKRLVVNDLAPRMADSAMLQHTL